MAPRYGAPSASEFAITFQCSENAKAIRLRELNFGRTSRLRKRNAPHGRCDDSRVHGLPGVASGRLRRRDTQGDEWTQRSPPPAALDGGARHHNGISARCNSKQYESTQLAVLRDNGSKPPAWAPIVAGTGLGGCA